MNTVKKYRICAHCKENKRITEFVRNRAKGGRTYVCYPCNRIYDAKKREEKKAYLKSHSSLFTFIKTRPIARAVAQYTMDGKFIKRFKNSKEAAEELGIVLSCLMRAAKSTNLSYKGYKWKFVVNDGVEIENPICQCCGKLTSKDLLAAVSMLCVQELQTYRRAKHV